jgi:predicted O-linked N-acetylglucosamine transferase (SPINDLY family)
MNVDPGLQVALTLRGRGQLKESVAALGQFLSRNPTHSEAIYYLALSLDELGKPDQAVEVYQRAVELNPTMAKAFSNLGGVLCNVGRLDESVAACRQAILLEPKLAPAHNNLGNALHFMAKVAEAADCYRRAAELAPNEPHYASSMLHALHFDPAVDAMDMLKQHQAWNARYAEPLKEKIRPHVNDRTPGRRLKIGYLSQNLDGHVLGVNLLPLLSQHNGEHFEVVCYAANYSSDAMTNLLRSHAGAWRDISRMNDDQAADLIRADAIDILIDLSLHSAGNRLLVFARKPAPVQGSYLGYCGTTGMTTMDWRFSDPYLDPVEIDLSVYTERTLRLPASYWCYQPRKSPDVSLAPSHANGFITFGCLNTFSKASLPAQQLWARILLATPRSRLILHSPPGSHRDEILKRYSLAGIAPDRIEFVPQLKWSDYIQTYQRIDFALDPFPYGGGITTFDALWMGVPVVSLSGHTAVGRGGQSILSNIGLPELIAHSPDEYVKIAADAEKWTALRPTLRQRMQDSPVMDAARLARDIESAYRQMWMDWLEK